MYIFKLFYIGHYVSKALEYIASTVLKEENGDRPNVHDVILLITKERSDDAGRLDLPGFHADYAPKVSNRYFTIITWLSL